MLLHPVLSASASGCGLGVGGPGDLVLTLEAVSDRGCGERVLPTSPDLPLTRKPATSPVATRCPRIRLPLHPASPACSSTSGPGHPRCGREPAPRLPSRMEPQAAHSGAGSKTPLPARILAPPPVLPGTTSPQTTPILALGSAVGGTQTEMASVEQVEREHDMAVRDMGFGTRLPGLKTWRGPSWTRDWPFCASVSSSAKQAL